MRKEKTPKQTYIESLVPVETSEMTSARLSSVELGLEGISLSSAEASLVQTLAQACWGTSGKKCVEIGTLTGLSALYWLQMLGSTGQLWSFEKSPEHFARAEKNLKYYIDRKQCHLLLGDAVEMLPSIDDNGPFDFIFIDGNKAAYLDYWAWAEKNVAKGGVIFVDNVFLGGSVFGGVDTGRFSAKQITVVREMNAKAFAHKDFLTTLIPTDEGLLMAKRIH